MKIKQNSGKSIIPVELITSKILLIRNEKVLLDKDLAELYGVETRVLNQSVKRNIARFPDDFMFQLTAEETRFLRSQFVTLKRGEHSKYLPYAFTEQGVAMLSSVLNSTRAIQVNIAIMRAFVEIRKFLYGNDALAQKLKELERKTKKKFADQQKQINVIFEAIKQLLTEETKPVRKIGF
ncbi:MAG: ORF6N domain-containing protein [Ignavibacteria bacterium]|nr:ORF6N domain-containing protein [Ignavibacteria bacterium]